MDIIITIKDDKSGKYLDRVALALDYAHLGKPGETTLDFYKRMLIDESERWQYQGRAMEAQALIDQTDPIERAT